MSMRGYYSAIQYCPDAMRAERVNIGAILIIPEIDYLKVQMTGDQLLIDSYYTIP